MFDYTKNVTELILKAEQNNEENINYDNGDISSILWDVYFC